MRPLTLVGRSFWGFFFFVFFVAQLYELLACGLVGLEWARALASLGCDWLCHMANLLSDDDDDADELVRALCCRGRAASDVGPDCTRAHSKLSSPCLLSEIQMKAQSCSLKSSLLNLISVARIRLAFKSVGRPNETEPNLGTKTNRWTQAEKARWRFRTRKLSEINDLNDDDDSDNLAHFKLGSAQKRSNAN